MAAPRPIGISFPKSASPGQKPSEGAGALINAFYEKSGGQDTWRRVPGCYAFADTGKATPRGSLDVNGVLFSAYDSSLVTTDPTGTVSLVPGGLPGSAPVSIARNNKSPTPDIFCVTEVGAYLITSGSIAAYNAGGVLPQPNSVSFLDGYALFTIGDGRVFATGLNSTTINALSFATCESRADGLVRGVVSAGQWYGFGQFSFEVWQNVGTTPFPLQRVATVPVGLIAANAIAGFEDGWDLPLIFVAPDCTVRRLNGFQPDPVSTPDVVRDIAALGDKSQLRASVYVHGDHPIWALSAPGWTWEYDAGNGAWHKRASYNQARWRGGFTVYSNGVWKCHDVFGSKILTLAEETFREDADPLVVTIEGVTKAFPNRLAIAQAWFDATVGQGNPLGTAEEQNPQVMLQWSRDGGATWSPASLYMALGQQGQFSQALKVAPVGLTTHHGMQWRVVFSAPVHFVFRGGKMLPEVRAPV